MHVGHWKGRSDSTHACPSSSTASNEQWLFTGILPNLYHPPETLALKSDVVGSLLVSSTISPSPHPSPSSLVDSDPVIRRRSRNQPVPTANACSTNCENRSPIHLRSFQARTNSLHSSKNGTTRTISWSSTAVISNTKTPRSISRISMR